MKKIFFLFSLVSSIVFAGSDATMGSDSVTLECISAKRDLTFPSMTLEIKSNGGTVISTTKLRTAPGKEQVFTGEASPNSLTIRTAPAGRFLPDLEFISAGEFKAMNGALQNAGMLSLTKPLNDQGLSTITIALAVNGKLYPFICN